MNTALQTTQENSLESQRVDLPVDIAWPDLQAAIAGNLNKLSAEGQVKYYNALCKFTGLNPLGFPFEWITFQGKLRLYPKKECADQLRGVHKISAKIIERTFFDDICMVRVMSTMPDGREFESTGAVPYSKGMPALDRCKALKVAETQAYRRGTFGLVGLGNLPDEDSDTRVSSHVAVETLGEESATARAEKLNAALEEKPVIDLAAHQDKSAALTETPLHTISQERPIIVQPPIEATATAESEVAPGVPAVGVQPDKPVRITPPPESSEPILSDTEVENLQAILSTYKDPKRAVDYLVYRDWCLNGMGLAFTKRNRYIEIVNKKDKFFLLVDGWKGNL